jgi:FkbM family methyltransferase
MLKSIFYSLISRLNVLLHPFSLKLIRFYKWQEEEAFKTFAALPYFKNYSGVILDVGSHEGESLQLFQKIFPKATLYAVEPNSEKKDFILPYLTNSEHLFVGALSNQSGKAVWHLNEDSGTSSLKESNESAQKFWEASIKTKEMHEVATLTLDDWMKSHSISELGLLKIDVQGSELDVLKGGQETLASGKVKHLHCEFTLINAYHDSAHLSDLLRLLEEFGFDLFDIQHLSRSGRRLTFFDGLFIHKSAMKGL